VEPTFNWRNMAFKLFWTVVATGAGLLVTETAGLPYWWALPLGAAANLVTSFARERLGQTTPTLPGPGPAPEPAPPV
jgi:hypothetical protein